MAKTADTRLNETIDFIRAANYPKAGAAADAVEAAVFNNAAYQAEIGDALTVGHYWSTSKEKRAVIRAIALIRIVRANLAIGSAQLYIQGGTSPLGRDINGYREMAQAELNRQLGQLIDATLVAPAIFNAQGWLMSSQMPNIANAQGERLFETQNARQAHFLQQVGQVANLQTREVYRQLVSRSGKLNWVATNPDLDNASKFQVWVRNNVDASENLDMNCWEAVLYCAFQANLMTPAQCRSLYANYNPNNRYENTRRLYGNDQPWATAAKNRGDILTWGLTRDNLDHMGMYLGTMADGNGQVDHYVGHLLSFNPVSTGVIHQVGRVHIEKVSVITANLPNYLCFVTEPFWVAGAPTNAYFQGL